MLAPAQTLVQYAPPGYLLFVRDKTLVAQPFDAKALKTTGEPVPLAEKIATDNVGLARFSVSSTGVLAYRTGESGGRLLWRDRSGKDLDTLGEPGDYANPAFSPSGDRVAFNINDARTGKGDIWIRDLARGVNSRFTLGAGNNYRAVWSPDGGTIVFSSDRGGTIDLYQKSTKGSGEEKLLLQTDEPKSASSWTTDGKYVGFASRSAKTVWDLWALPTFGDRKPIPDRGEPVRRDAADVLARRALRRLRVDRVRPRGDLRPDISGGRREVAGFQRRRHAIRAGGATARSSTTVRRTRSSWRSRSAGAPTSRWACRRRSLPFTCARAPRATSTRRLRTASASSSPPRSAGSRCLPRRSS